MKAVLKRLIRPFWSRMGRPAVPPSAAQEATFAERKARKLSRIRALLDHPTALDPSGHFYDYLSPELRHEFHIVDTSNVSAHEYDPHAMALINQFPDGFVLDCGAGLRRTYYDNVVNFEICSYETTDVRGVGERLPFRSGVFDAVFSLNVLEHVRDPFTCAREIIRVLKPGGRLYCVVPFLQPFHAYPHHYFNMTAQGLRNLFEDHLEINGQEVGGGGQPIFMLTWVLRRWAEGLSGSARREFLEMKVADLMDEAIGYVDRSFVTKLPEEFRFELAATTTLFARKPDSSRS